MKKFEVEIKQTNTYNVPVFAENEEHAEKLALELFEREREEYFSDSDSKIEVFEI